MGDSETELRLDFLFRGVAIELLARSAFCTFSVSLPLAVMRTPPTPSGPSRASSSSLASLLPAEVGVEAFLGHGDAMRPLRSNLSRD